MGWGIFNINHHKGDSIIVLKNFQKGDLKEQAHQVFKNIKSILADQGLDFTNVVKTTVLLDNINDFATVNKIYREYCAGDILPARAAYTVECLPKNSLVEIEVIAYYR